MIRHLVAFTRCTLLLAGGYTPTAQKLMPRNVPSTAKLENTGKGQGLCRYRHRHTLLVGHKWWLIGIILVYTFIYIILPFKFSCKCTVWTQRNQIPKDVKVSFLFLTVWLLIKSPHTYNEMVTMLSQHSWHSGLFTPENPNQSSLFFYVIYFWSSWFWFHIGNMWAH